RGNYGCSTLAARRPRRVLALLALSRGEVAGRRVGTTSADEGGALWQLEMPPSTCCKPAEGREVHRRNTEGRQYSTTTRQVSKGASYTVRYESETAMRQKKRRQREAGSALPGEGQTSGDRCCELVTRANCDLPSRAVHTMLII
uniref:Ig-like domain-containing protein n=1 Tax=Macrostomum lignano TaxID=282301 RepID=A0A1I8FLM3_9PLAT